DVLTQLARLANGVHDLAEQVFVGQLLDIASREAPAILRLELRDLAAGDLLVLRAHSLAGVELSAVDEDRRRTSAPLPIDDVAEKWKCTRHEHRGPVTDGLLPSGDVIEHELRDIGVAAHDDEHGGREVAHAAPIAVGPERVVLPVVLVQRLDRALE